MEPFQKVFQTSVGEVILSDYYTRKAERLWLKEATKNHTTKMVKNDQGVMEEKIDFPVENMQDASDAMLLGCILSVAGQLPTQQMIDRMKPSEFNKIKEVCEAMKKQEEMDKKK